MALSKNTRIWLVTGVLLTSLALRGGAQEALVNNKIVPPGEPLYLDVYEVGKLSGAKIKAFFHLSNAKGFFHVSWTHVYMTPFPKEREVGLRIEHFGTDDGTIKNIQLNADHTVTFDMVSGPEGTPGLLTERKMSLWLKLTDDDRSVLAVTGTMIFWDESLAKQVTLEWKQAKEPGFKLPFSAVF